MALFLKYIRQHRKEIFEAVLFCAIFAVVFALYRLPLEAVLYPSLLCALIGMLFFLFSFSKAKGRYIALERIRENVSAEIGKLPVPAGIEEEAYQEILFALQEKMRELETSSASKYDEMVEYYTLWAHQIKTPIASMRLHLQNEDSESSRRLQAELFRIEQYVEMVLAYLRLESTSNDYVFREYSVDAIVRQAVKKFSREFILRKISLRYDEIDLVIVTDEKWLLFVLEQIISNALKYTREGSIKIEMREGTTLCIEDTGIGIAAEDLPRIFENGYTGYNGRSDKRASGIGLYLCKRICTNLGIGISVKSEVGKGSVVELKLDQYKIKTE